MKKKHSIVRRESAGLTDIERLERRLKSLETAYEAEIDLLHSKVNTLSQALRISHDRTAHVINEFGLDIPERLRPRR